VKPKDYIIGAAVSWRTMDETEKGAAGTACAGPGGAGSRRAHATVIAVILAGLAAGLVLETAVRRGESVLTLWGHRMPTTCSFRLATGLPCASCGLTRSVVLLLHCRILDSWAQHPFGVPTLALILLALPPRVAGVLGRRPRWAARWDRAWGWSAVGTVLAMLLWWIVRLAVAWRTGGAL
jgi:hypothetical protein